MPTTTTCWNCHEQYDITEPQCPCCPAINANVDYDGAREQQQAVERGVSLDS